MIPLSLSYVLLAALTMLLSIPLILRKVPMNRWYGVRIRDSFRSEAHWFEINRYGGRALFWWSLFVGSVGLAGWLFDERPEGVYFGLSILLILLALVLTVGATYRHAVRSRDRFK